MVTLNSTTNRRKFKHLTPIERGKIDAMKKSGKTLREIADSLGKHKSTISRELARGTVKQKKSPNKYYSEYFHEAGQAIYEKNRMACGRKLKFMTAFSFVERVDELMLDEEYSPETSVKRIGVVNESFDHTVCYKTIYNYIDKGFIRIKNIDLLLKTRRQTKKDMVRKNKKRLGKSISERPAIVADRKEFGHWEIDTVIGKKTGDEAILTILERKTRANITIKIEGRNEHSVFKAIKKYQTSLGHNFPQVFKTITADNGSEFSRLSDAVKHCCTDVFFTHPYSSFERGSNEKHNSLIRRFIPKGKSISSFRDKEIQKAMNWCNNLPRKILGFKTPLEFFNEEIELLQLESLPA